MVDSMLPANAMSLLLERQKLDEQLKEMMSNRGEELEKLKMMISFFNFTASELGFSSAQPKTRAVSILLDKASGAIYTGGPTQPAVFKEMSKEDKEKCRVSMEELKAYISEKQKKDKTYKPLLSVAFQQKFDAS